MTVSEGYGATAALFATLAAVVILFRVLLDPVTAKVHFRLYLLAGASCAVAFIMALASVWTEVLL